MMDPRHFLASAASLAGIGAGAGLLSTLPSRSLAAGEDYRALVIVFLTGGNDGCSGRGEEESIATLETLIQRGCSL